MRVYKYALDILDEQEIRMPPGKIVSLGEQNGDLYIWALVDETAAPRPHRIGMRGTGHPCPYPPDSFIGTVQMGNGLIWHVFDLEEAPDA